MNKDDYIVRRLSKIRNKPWESYVISRVFHKLDDPDIEFVTQQLVRLLDGKWVFTDMYFPQLGIHLEIDESHHLNKEEADQHRTEDIVSVTGHQIERIATAQKQENGTQTTIPIESVNAKIDAFIKKLQNKKSQQIESGKFVAWNFDKQYDPARHKKNGKIDCTKSVLLRRQREALSLFGYTGGDYQRGVWKIPGRPGDVVWFPRLYKQDDWDNQLSDDGKVITEIAISAKAEKIRNRNLARGRNEGTRVVFARVKNTLGQTLYRYVGTFEKDREASDLNKHIFRRSKTMEKTVP